MTIDFGEGRWLWKCSKNVLVRIAQSCVCTKIIELYTYTEVYLIDFNILQKKSFLKRFIIQRWSLSVRLWEHMLQDKAAMSDI